MENEDYDEDIYEETTSKIVYRKRSSPSRVLSSEAIEEENVTSGADRYLERKTVLDDEFREFSNQNDAQSTRLGDIGRQQAVRSRSAESVDEAVIKTSKDETGLREATYDHKHESWSDTDLQATDKVKEEIKDWSERAKKTARDKVPKSTDSSRTRLKGKISSDAQSYYSVAKWEVDYNNKNFVRSKCNKPRGQHRYIFGKPYEWEIDYDNRYYLRSKVNPPKGLHRRGHVLARKYVPDKDILADSTGWEFEYGPEFDQIEDDVPFHRRERITGKGGYRFYGVRRNNSDTDHKIEEKQYDIKGFLLDELKYGAEFLQEDVPHMMEVKDRRMGRGGYRYLEAERNVYDVRPRDVPGVDYRASRASIDLDLDKEEVARKGKPFKRTILKKTFRLVKPPSPENFTHGTLLSFVPGRGSKVYYEGKSTKPPVLEVKKHPSIRNIFKSKRGSSYEKQSRRKDSDFRNRDERGGWTNYQEASPERSVSRRYSLDEYQGRKVREDRRSSFHDYQREYKKETTFRQPKEEYYYSGRTTDDSERHKFPSEIQNRITEIKHKVARKGTSRDKDRSIPRKFSSYQDETSDIDWRSHIDHPHDHGKSITEAYEKFVNERGSEIWIKTEEKYSEFHHTNRS